MNYHRLNTLLQGRNHSRRKLANNTHAIRDTIGDAIYIRLHNTPILTFTPDGNVRYNTGGWHTVTTKQRMNQYGPAYIYQRKHTWFVTYMGEVEHYFDGITLATLTQTENAQQ